MKVDRKRANIGFEADLDDFDPQAWTPEPVRPTLHPAPQQVRQTAEALGFRSREAAVAPQEQPPAPAKQVRRRRTGRNQQFNLKARPETIEAFCRIADAQGWGLGETLEIAVALLEERYGGSRAGD